MNELHNFLARKNQTFFKNIFKNFTFSNFIISSKNNFFQGVLRDFVALNSTEKNQSMGKKLVNYSFSLLSWFFFK